MNRSLGWRACALALGTAVCTAGAAQEDNTPKGVNPRDNLTKVDLIHRYEGFDGGTRIHALALKYDRALTAKLGANLEVPLVRLSSDAAGESGLGDVEMRIRYVRTEGAVSWLGAVEVVAPTATSDLLGSGRWQVNPAVGAVYALSPTTFVYAGYKRIVSVGGSSDRADISQSQPRLLAAITSPRGWWTLADLTYTRDHRRGTDSLDIEAEAGKMIERDLAISVRLGTSMLDSNRNLMLGINVRRIF